MASREEVVAAARQHVGTPWVHQGRTAGVALDCLGMVIFVVRELGLVEPGFDINGYARWPDGTMLEVCDRHMHRIADIELGAVLVMSTAEEPQHLGIVGDYLHGGWSLIHSSNASKPARCIETRLMFARNAKQRGVYRLPGVG